MASLFPVLIIDRQYKQGYRYKFLSTACFQVLFRAFGEMEIAETWTKRDPTGIVVFLLPHHQCMFNTRDIVKTRSFKHILRR